MDVAYNNGDLEDHLHGWLSDARRVFHRGGVNSEIDAMVDLAVRRRDRARQHFGTGPVAVEDPSALLAELRLRKSSSEIDQMVYASKVAAIAHELAMRHSREGVTEYQLQSIIEGFFPMLGPQVGRILPSWAAVKTQPSFITLRTRTNAALTK